MQYTTDYFWVVVCKNRRFHRKGNTDYDHKILPGEAEAYGTLPMLPKESRYIAITAERNTRTNRKKLSGTKLHPFVQVARLSDSTSYFLPLRVR